MSKIQISITVKGRVYEDNKLKPRSSRGSINAATMYLMKCGLIYENSYRLDIDNWRDKRTGKLLYQVFHHPVY